MSHGREPRSSGPNWCGEPAAYLRLVAEGVKKSLHSGVEPQEVRHAGAAKRFQLGFGLPDSLRMRRHVRLHLLEVRRPVSDEVPGERKENGFETMENRR